MRISFDTRLTRFTVSTVRSFPRSRQLFHFTVSREPLSVIRKREHANEQREYHLLIDNQRLREQLASLLLESMPE